jgi:hypothetical protein
MEKPCVSPSRGRVSRASWNYRVLPNNFMSRMTQSRTMPFKKRGTRQSTKQNVWVNISAGSRGPRTQAPKMSSSDILGARCAGSRRTWSSPRTLNPTACPQTPTLKIGAGEPMFSAQHDLDKGVVVHADQPPHHHSPEGKQVLALEAQV